MKSKKLRKAAENAECTVNLYPYCGGDQRTTVLAHLNCEDKGMGFKSPDFWGVHACNDCHDIIDGRKKTILTQDEIDACVLRGLYRTQKRLIEAGLIQIL